EAGVVRLDRCRDRLGAIAQLRVNALNVDVEAPARTDQRGRQRRPRSDRDGVGAHIGAQRVQRLRCGDAEAAALAGREPPEAVVRAELASALVDDRAAFRLHAVPPEEVAVVVPGEEARLLALEPPRRRESRVLGLPARLLLRLRAEGEPEP